MKYIKFPRFLKNIEVIKLYQIYILYIIAFSLLGPFEMIYLSKSFGLSITVVFYIIVYLSNCLPHYLVLKLFKRINSDLNIIAVFTSLLIYFLILFFSRNASEILLGGIFRGLSMGFFWVLFNFGMLFDVRKDEIATSYGLTSFINFISSFFPLLSGYLITVHGYWMLFLLLIVVTLFSYSLILGQKFKFEKIRYMRRQLSKKLKTMYFLQGWVSVVQIIFIPLLVYKLTTEEFLTGGAFTLLLFMSSLAIIALDRVSDLQKRRSKIIKVLTPIAFLFSIATGFVSNVIYVIALRTVVIITLTVIYHNLFSRLKRFKHNLRVVVDRNSWLMCGRTLSVIICYLFLFHFNSFKLLFVFEAIGILSLYVIHTKYYSEIEQELKNILNFLHV